MAVRVGAEGAGGLGSADGWMDPMVVRRGRQRSRSEKCLWYWGH